MSKAKSKKRSSPKGPIRWSGKHVFYIAGTDHDDDTIRIPASHRKDEILYKLLLPTLCITYADMIFANDIGGVQADFPDSKVYGKKYFDPPIELKGEKEIEKYTWIRGAERVIIGPKETIIEWWGWHDLVIPKLRIRAKEKVKTLLSVSDVRINIAEPFVAKVQQYTDGRHVGGIQLTKRHPDWKPEPGPKNYDLFIRVIDGKTRRAIPEARIRLFTWDEKKRAFITEATYYTNKMGIVDIEDLPCSEKKLVTVVRSPWLTQTWRFRPLPGQKVKSFFQLWHPIKIEVPYAWRLQDTLKAISVLTTSSGIELLRMNSLRSDRELNPGKAIKIPCLEATHHVEARDTLERIAEYFCYKDADELSKANELSIPVKLYLYQELRLPGWMFFQAQHDDLFERIDEQFGLPCGWSRPAQRTLHDDPTRAYENEVIAVPALEFVHEHKLKRLY